MSRFSFPPDRIQVGFAIGLTVTVFASMEVAFTRVSPEAHGGELVVGDDDDVATARGDYLRGSADLARGSGRGALLRSLSAKELQEALRLRLENREEYVEQYYELRALRDDAVLDDRNVTAELAREIAARGAPDRLSENQFNPETGEVYWPSPLDHESLKPYRKPIEDTFAKRASPGEKYREWDFLKVHNMIN